MIAGLALGSDNKRYFRGQLPRLAIITIILMPLLYGAMYLWAFWNPFGEVDKIPAAIVNLDRGAEEDGKPLHAGADVTKSLIDSGQLDLKEVSASEAADGLADGAFYFTITLPENFSKAVVSPSGNDPTKAKLRFTFNDANNYLSTIIGQDASEQVINQVNTDIGAQAVDKVLIMVESSGAQLAQAVEGAGELANGLQEAESGADKLAGGAGQLSSGIDEAKSGTVQLAAGTAELQSKLDTALVPASRFLHSTDLASINADVADAVDTAEEVLQRLTALEKRPLAKAINRAIAHLEASADPVAREIGATLAAASRTYRRDIARANRAARGLRSDLRTLERKLGAGHAGGLEQQLTEIERRLASDVAELRSGLQRLDSGADRLNSGMTRLQSGGTELAAGTNTLVSGTVKLADGADELHSGLQSGLDQVPTWSKQQRVKTADTLSTPVDLKQEIDNEAPTFGTGFAPFFSSLSLFVGSILCWMLLTPLQSRPVVAGLGPYRTAIASYVPAIVVGALQATVLFLVVRFGLGLTPTHPLGMLLFMILMSMTFLAMIQAFNAIFDVAIGRVVTLAFLMVQLISAGGIYPVPTTALPFQIIHPFDPMTYTVDGLRQLTVAAEVDSRLWVAIVVLLGITLVALTATALVVRRNRQYTMERLYPSIEV